VAPQHLQYLGCNLVLFLCRLKRIAHSSKVDGNAATEKPGNHPIAALPEGTIEYRGDTGGVGRPYAFPGLIATSIAGETVRTSETTAAIRIQAKWQSAESEPAGDGEGRGIQVHLMLLPRSRPGSRARGLFYRPESSELFDEPIGLCLASRESSLHCRMSSSNSSGVKEVGSFLDRQPRV